MPCRGRRGGVRLLPSYSYCTCTVRIHCTYCIYDSRHVACGRPTMVIGRQHPPLVPGGVGPAAPPGQQPRCAIPPPPTAIAGGGGANARRSAVPPHPRPPPPLTRVSSGRTAHLPPPPLRSTVAEKSGSPAWDSKSPWPRTLACRPLPPSPPWGRRLAVARPPCARAGRPRRRCRSSTPHHRRPAHRQSRRSGVQLETGARGGGVRGWSRGGSGGAG